MTSAKHVTDFVVESDRVKYSEETIKSVYDYCTSEVRCGADGRARVTPKTTRYSFRTQRRVPKLGVMLVGWGGNNGTTFTAGVLANRHGVTWNTKTGPRTPDYLGSITQAATLRLGVTPEGDDVYVPFKDCLPMVNPNDIEIDGWDINDMPLAEAMGRAQVLDFDLQQKLAPRMRDLRPRPSVYYPSFIAANQAERANHVLGGSKQDHLDRIRDDIRDFKASRGLDKVIVLWTANTERFAELVPGVNDTAANLLEAIRTGHDEVSPSTVFACASILEGCTYINGSPQNTFVPGCYELALREGVYIGGDDFKSGQTKFKSVMVDFLVSAGIKPCSVASYNHLGNNDGRNLSAPSQFRSKEISKSNVVDDMVASNRLLYAPGEKPDHCVVIKYMPHVGDSKRAMDEYANRIFLGGENTIAVHNTCEDSLLAAPLMVDLVVLAEMTERITFKTDAEPGFHAFHPVMSLLSLLLKAPLVPKGTPVVNAFFRQRSCIENIFRACLGLAPENNMMMEHKAPPRVKGVPAARPLAPMDVMTAATNGFH